MDKQFIISISREYGSGGHWIASELAKRFGVVLYDHNLLDEMAAGKGMNVERLSKYDELPRKKLFSRSVRGFSSSPEEVLAQLQFDYLKEKAQSGESFVVVGRCSESVLRGQKGLIPVFILADQEEKIARIEKIRNFSREEAEAAVERHDRRRKSYHNYYCDIKWGDSRHYDLCINSSRLGVEKTTDFLEGYIRGRLERLK